jgi:hypothetical protein
MVSDIMLSEKIYYFCIFKTITYFI